MGGGDIQRDAGEDSDMNENRDVDQRPARKRKIGRQRRQARKRGQHFPLSLKRMSVIVIRRHCSLHSELWLCYIVQGLYLVTRARKEANNPAHTIDRRGSCTQPAHCALKVPVWEA